MVLSSDSSRLLWLPSSLPASNPHKTVVEHTDSMKYPQPGMGLSTQSNTL